MQNSMEGKIKPYFCDERRKFNLYLGDVLDLLALVKKESIDMIFVDPPYNLSNGGFTVHAGKRVSVNKGDWDRSNGVENDFDFHYKWIEACRRVLKPSATIWISGTYHSIYKCGYALQKLKFKILNEISWYKPNASPNLSGRYFAASHETLIWAKKDENTKHTFNYELMKKGKAIKEDFFKKQDKQMRSVWSIKDINGTETLWPINTPKPAEKKFGKHPTQKPVELLKRIILASTNVGDWILDPFTGSSTTGIVAYGLERKFIGIDKEKQYLDLSIKRFQELDQSFKNKLF